jgi:hypothetical protein
MPIVKTVTTLPGSWGSRNFSTSWAAVKAKFVGVLPKDSLRSSQVKGSMSIAREVQHGWVIGNVLRIKP